MKSRFSDSTRRGFLKSSGAALGALAFPSIIPASVLGAAAPSKRIAVGIIGCGRIAATMDAPGLFANRDLATCVALADPDLSRVTAFRELVRGKWACKDLADARCHQDYRQLIADPAVDAVMICTPEHWHARMLVEAAMAGKDVYVQKPMAMSVTEGRAIVDAVKKYGRVFHMGTQQRSEGPDWFGPQFRQAVEFVWDGRIGKVAKVEIGLPQDPDEYDWPTAEPIPEGFDWELWLGPAPYRPYSRLGSHARGTKADPKNGYDIDTRPGWLTIQDYCMGMITGWGSHHLDIAQWGLGEQLSGPDRIKGSCTYPRGRRLWDVHGPCDITLAYDRDNGIHTAGCEVRIVKEPDAPCGVRFIGENGEWIFCARGKSVTASDPKTGSTEPKPLDASKPDLVVGHVAKQAVRNTKSHHRIWFESIATRRETNVPVEVAQRSTTACILAYWSMKLGRELKWNPATERFVNDAEADKTLVRAERGNWGLKPLLKYLYST